MAMKIMIMIENVLKTYFAQHNRILMKVFPRKNTGNNKDEDTGSLEDPDHD